MKEISYRKEAINTLKSASTNPAIIHPGKEPLQEIYIEEKMTLKQIEENIESNLSRMI